MKILITLIITLWFCCGVAMTQSDWTYVTSAADGGDVYYLPKRTVKKGLIARTWVKFVKPESNKTESQSVTLYEFDCKEGRYREIQQTIYYRSGSNSSRNSRNPIWSYITPDTLIEEIVKTVCGRKSSPLLPEKPLAKSTNTRDYGWVLATNAESGDTSYYFLPNLIERMPNGYLRTWTNTVSKNKSGLIEEYIAFIEFDRVNRRSRSLKVRTVTDGKVQDSYIPSKLEWYSHSDPETLGGLVLRKVCHTPRTKR